MAKSPFSMPPIPSFGGIAGKAEMIKTVKTVIEEKVGFAKSVANSVAIKVTQKANEAKDAAVKELREKGKSAIGVAKEKQAAARAKLKTEQIALTSKLNEVSTDAAGAVTSAKSIPTVVKQNPKLEELTKARVLLENTVQVSNEAVSRAQTELDTLISKGATAGVIAEKKAELTANQVEHRYLSSKLESITSQIDTTFNQIIG